MGTKPLAEFVGNKDLARAMGLSTRSVRRWAKLLGVAPTVPANSCQRWSHSDAAKLIQRWKQYWQQKNPNHEPQTV